MTIPKLIQMIATVCGIHPSTLARYFAELRAAKLIRVSGRGGGKAAVDLNHWEASTVLAALCALGPGKAVDAVAIFKTIRRVGSNEPPTSKAVLNYGSGEIPEWGDLPCDTLWYDLAALWIARLAREIQFHPDRKLAEHGLISTWELVACLDSSRAWISYTEDGKKTVQYYCDPQSEMSESGRHPGRRGIRQMAHVDATVLEVLARLFNDCLSALVGPSSVSSNVVGGG